MSIPQDRSSEQRDSDRVSLLVPLVVLIVGATAIPVELRRFDLATLSLHFGLRDVVVNLLLYAPVGVILVRRGFWPTVMIATFLSLSAELCQFFTVHRFPSPIDLALNVTGAIVGWMIGRRWRIDVPAFRVNVRTASLSALAALAILATAATSEWGKLFWNCRGAILPGCWSALDVRRDGRRHRARFFR